MRNAISKVRGAAPGELAPALAREARSVVRRGRQKVKRRLTTGQTKLVELGLGPEVANDFFWATPFGTPVWFDVRRRLERLGNDPKLSVNFVEKALEESVDSTTIIGLARHPLSQAAVKRWLESSLPTEERSVIVRIQNNPAIGGALAGIAAQLLPEPLAHNIDGWIIGLYETLDNRHYAVRDSVGFSPTKGAVKSITPAKRRLVIANDAADLDQIELLFAGASSGTLLTLTDTFGKTSFTDGRTKAAWFPPVTVEHLRSRITRFSQEYVDLHDGTRLMGNAIADQVAPGFRRFDPENTRFLRVAVADFLFFQSLKSVAIARLLADSGFDDVVIALQNEVGKEEYTRLLSTLPQIAEDDRISVVSLSRSTRRRQLFWQVLDQIEGHTPDPEEPGRTIPAEDIDNLIDNTVSELLEKSKPSMRSTGGRVLVATCANQAYDRATARYIEQLSKTLDPAVLFVGRNAAELRTALDELGGRAARVELDFLTIPSEVISPVARRVRSLIDFDQLQSFDGVVASTARVFVTRMSQDAIAHLLVESHLLAGYFSQLVGLDAAPEALVVTPNRPPRVAIASTAARRHAIPSVALEPHAQDANYSRYAKVATDYYGTLSNFHSSRANTSFKIEPDRIATIGSPRQPDVASYDRAKAREKARSAARESGGSKYDKHDLTVVFFGQPSKWDHVAKVWTNIVQAAAGASVHVVLKPHPEESSTRIADYLKIASEAGAAELVTLADDFEAAIAASDIGLTAYSAAAVDSVLRGLPIVVVTDGDVEYPVDMGELIGAPTVRSTEELVELIELYRSDPDAVTRYVTAFAEREPQLASGKIDSLTPFIEQVIAAGPAGIRPWDDIPDDLLFEGPHPTFEV